jgi:hypothetical protein
MPQTTVTAYFDETFYIEINFLTKRAFHFVFFIYNLTYTIDVLLAEVLNPGIGIHAAGSQNPFTGVRAYAVDILQRDLYSFFFRNVHTGYTCHIITPALSLALLMFRVLANNTNHSAAPDNLTFITSTFNRRAYFHLNHLKAKNPIIINFVAAYVNTAI